MVVEEDGKNATASASGWGYVPFTMVRRSRCGFGADRELCEPYELIPTLKR